MGTRSRRVYLTSSRPTSTAGPESVLREILRINLQNAA